MAKLYVFNLITLDGYFEGPSHDINWHNVDQEFGSFAIEQLQQTSTLLFGRRTYQMMASFWPSAEGLQADPETATLMNNLPKVVFSHTLESADWQNTTLIKTDAIEAIKKLKSTTDKDIAIFGSSEFCSSIIPSGIIDEYRLMINPVVIGDGTPLFHGIKQPLSVSLLNTRTFANGNILAYYQSK